MNDINKKIEEIEQQIIKFEELSLSEKSFNSESFFSLYRSIKNNLSVIVDRYEPETMDKDFEFYERMESFDDEADSLYLEGNIKANLSLVNEMEELKKQIKNERSEITKDTKALQDEIIRVQQETKTAQDEVLQAQKDVIKTVDSRLQKTSNSINTLSVTILGIFVAITFSAFGSINMINSILSSANNQTDNVRIIFVFSLLAIFIFNFAFLLFYSISRIINKSLALRCISSTDSNQRCSVCKRHKHAKWLCRVSHKYTHIFYIDAILTFSIIVCCIIFIIRGY